MIYFLWKKKNPASHDNKYISDLNDIFGPHVDLKSITIAKILQIIGFTWSCHFKIIILEISKKNQNVYHWEKCTCLTSKYHTKLIFTNKMHISHNPYTFIFLNNDVFLAKNEIYGRTIFTDLKIGYVTDTLPSDKNLLFFYSHLVKQQNVYCILNRVADDDIYFNVEICSNKYLLTRICKPKKIDNFHLTYEMINSVCPKKKENENKNSYSCQCNINEKDGILLQPIGYREVMKNIQIMLYSMNLYSLFKPILTFISRLKIISYDIETRTRYLT